MFLYKIKSCYLVIYFAVSLTLICTFSCNKISHNSQNRVEEILKIGNVGFTRHEFERYKKSIEQDGISTDSLIVKILTGFYKKALLISYLETINYKLSDDEYNNLNYSNRLSLIKLAIKKKYSNVEIKKYEIQREYNRFHGKQVIIDYIWLPKNDKELINECFSFLHSGGNIVDFINSKEDTFDKIFYDYKGIVRRINVKPGMFCAEISRFIDKSNIGDIKTIKTKSGYHIIKIFYKCLNPLSTINENEIEFNLKKSKCFESGYSPIQKLIKQNNFYFNDSILNTMDFTVRSSWNNIDSTAFGEFKGIKIYKDEIIEKISNLPFNDKIYFSNTSCKPAAVATLILQNHQCKPVSTKIFLLELYNANKENNKKTTKDNQHSDINILSEDYKKPEEYKYLKRFEESNIYPWLFPNLFKEFNRVKINYEIIYNTQLVKINPFTNNDTVAHYKNFIFDVNHFYGELNKLTVNSLSDMLQIENATKIIYYYFNKYYHVPASKVNINIPLLQDIILNYSKDLDFHVFSNNILSDRDNIRKRIGYNDNTVILKFDDKEINVEELRKIVSRLPLSKQLLFEHDYINNNKFWRINLINELIDQEIWLKEAYNLDLQNSKEYEIVKRKNEQNSLIKSFLNSFNSTVYDSINSKLNKVINDNKYELNFYFDSIYFKDNMEVFNNVHNNRLFN